jgi:hypothetical protein
MSKNEKLIKKLVMMLYAQETQLSNLNIPALANKLKKKL